MRVEQPIEVGERACEVVLALLERCPEQQRGRRHVVAFPPGSERGLRLPEKARIAQRSRRLQRFPHHRNRDVEIPRIGHEHRAHPLELRQRRVAFFRQPFEHDRIAFGQERLGGEPGGHQHERRGDRHALQSEEASPHRSAYGGECRLDAGSIDPRLGTLPREGKTSLCEPVSKRRTDPFRMSSAFCSLPAATVTPSRRTPITLVSVS